MSEAEFAHRRHTVRSMSTEAMVDIAANISIVKAKIAAAACHKNVRLVAVSKTKPIEMLDIAYDAGCRCFGENYVQELLEKTELWKDRSDVHWHFIGALQSNKCKALVNCVDDISRLTVETVSSIKLADKLNHGVKNREQRSYNLNRLKVFVQVNTSGEDSKSGVKPGLECVSLCEHIVSHCEELELVGLMTIGAIGDLHCFTVLKQCRCEVLEATNSVSELELSMGMSGDFEVAVVEGSTNVRVGSTIFGVRDYNN